MPLKYESRDVVDAWRCPRSQSRHKDCVEDAADRESVLTPEERLFGPNH